AARADDRARPAPRRAGAEARRAAGAGPRAATRARRAHGVDRSAARARAGGGRGARHTSQRGPAPGAVEHRAGLGEHRRGGGAVVSHTGSTRPVRSAGRLNAPRPALVEANASGVPQLVNRQSVALVREEWRVVDRWWTEEPVVRRYFELVLDSGQNSVVFRDEERCCWFTQRA